MKHTETIFRPVFLVEFTAEDIAELERNSKSHYDGLCRSLSERGGKIYGWKNQIEFLGVVRTLLEFRDLDLLAKVMERSGSALFDQLYKLLREAANAKP